MSTTSTIARLLASALLFLAVQTSHAVTLNWNTISGTAGDWVAGGNTGAFEVDGTNGGNDISISIAQNNGDPWTAGYPQNVQNGASTVGNNDQHYLQLRTPGMVDTTRSFTVTITFNYVGGVYASFGLIDVDSQTGAGGWIDNITNITGNSGTVAMNVAGSAANTVSGSGLGVSVAGNTAVGNITDHSGDVSVSSGTNKVTSITFTWSNPGPNFGGQVISLSNIVFFTTPEVGSSLGALGACAALAAFTRRRRQAVA